MTENYIGLVGESLAGKYFKEPSLGAQWAIILGSLGSLGYSHVDENVDENCGTTLRI